MPLVRDYLNNVTKFLIFFGCVMKDNAYKWFVQNKLQLNKICWNKESLNHKCKRTI